jgi:hypothetical protein
MFLQMQVGLSKGSAILARSIGILSEDVPVQDTDSDDSPRTLGSDDDDDDDDDDSSSAAKRKRRRVNNDENSDESEDSPCDRKKRRKSKIGHLFKTLYDTDGSDSEQGNNLTATPMTRADAIAAARKDNSKESEDSSCDR